MASNQQSRSSGRNNSIRIRESERIDPVAGSVEFACGEGWACNPGLAGSFPWLSTLAGMYENYKVHKLCYRYKNLKGSTANGNIILSFDYDTLDSAPTSTKEATQMTVYCDGAPWRIFELRVPTDNRKLFTRAGIPAVADLKTYDVGRLFVCTEGCADNSIHGYLEVDYDIEFFNKQPAPQQANMVGNTSEFYTGTNYNLAADTTYTIPFTADTVNQCNLTPNEISDEFVVPKGKYMYQCNVLVKGNSGTPGNKAIIDNLELRVNGASIVPTGKAHYENQALDDGVEQSFDWTGVLDLTAASTMAIIIATTTYGAYLQAGFSKFKLLQIPSYEQIA